MRGGAWVVIGENCDGAILGWVAVRLSVRLQLRPAAACGRMRLTGHAFICRVLATRLQ